MVSNWNQEKILKNIWPFRERPSERGALHLIRLTSFIERIRLHQEVRLRGALLTSFIKRPLFERRKRLNFKKINLKSFSIDSQGKQFQGRKLANVSKRMLTRIVVRLNLHGRRRLLGSTMEKIAFSSKFSVPGMHSLTSWWLWRQCTVRTSACSACHALDSAIESMHWCIAMEDSPDSPASSRWRIHIHPLWKGNFQRWSPFFPVQNKEKF